MSASSHETEPVDVSRDLLTDPARYSSPEWLAWSIAWGSVDPRGADARWSVSHHRQHHYATRLMLLHSRISPPERCPVCRIGYYCSSHGLDALQGVAR